MDQLIAIVLRPENFAIVAAVWALLDIVRRALPQVSASKVWARLLPVLPLPLAMSLLWVPGLTGAPMGIGDRIVLGVILGWGVGWAHKTWHQTVRGRDGRISQPPAEPPPSPSL